jgi:hypothetical protein
MTSNTWFENSFNQFIALTLAFAALSPSTMQPHLFFTWCRVLTLCRVASGIKFLMVLIFSFMGALSIATVSLVAGLFFYFPNDYTVSLELAVVNAVSPAAGA